MFNFLNKSISLLSLNECWKYLRSTLILVKTQPCWLFKALFTPFFFRFVCVLLFLGVNTALSIRFLFFTDTEFPSVQLFLFLANTSMYLIFYIGGKYSVEEKLTRSAQMFGILSILFMVPALWFFESKVKSTGVGASLSKEINEPCFGGLDYFDHHDFWHFLSR